MKKRYYRFIISIIFSMDGKTRRRIQVDAKDMIGALKRSLKIIEEEKVEKVWGIKITGEPYPVGTKELQKFLKSKEKYDPKKLRNKLLTIKQVLQ